MPQMIDDENNIWEVDANGNPTRFLGKAGNTPAPVTLGRPNAAKVLGDNLSNTKAQLDISRIQATASADARKAEAEARKAELDAEKAAKEAAASDGDPKQKAALRAEAIQKIQLARSLRDRSNQWFATGALSSIPRNIGGTTAYDVAQDTDTLKNAGALQRIMEMAQTNGGKNPLTPLSNSDFQALANSLANLDPSQSDAQYQRNLKIIEDMYVRAYQNAGGADLESEIDPTKRKQMPGAIVGSNGVQKSQQVGAQFNGGGGGGIATGNEKSVAIPPEMQAEFDAFLKANPRGNLDPNAYAAKRLELNAKYGFGISPTDLQTYLSEGKAYNENLNRPFNMSIPAAQGGATTAIERGYGKMFTDPIAGPPLAAVANAANMGGFGIPQMLAGKQAFDSIQNESPIFSALGQVGGAITGSNLVAGAGRQTLGRIAPPLLGGGGKAQFGRTLLADATYGGAVGGTTEGDPVTGAVYSALGSGIGQGAGSLLGRTIQGVANPELKALSQVAPLTIGQIGRGTNSMVGKVVAGVEDRLAGLPVVGDAINAARRRGIEGYNTAQINEQMTPLGVKVSGPGHTGANQAGDAINAAYDTALSQMNLTTDDAFTNATAGNPFADIVDQVKVGDVIPGRGFQGAKRTIDESLNALKSDPMGYQKRPQLENLRVSLFDLAQRQAPEALQLYRNADEAYAGMVPINRAVAQAQNTDALFSPAQFGTALRTTDRSANKGMTAKGLRPGQTLQEVAQSILPSTVPDSGTVGRAALMALPIGASQVPGVDPATAALFALPAIAYSKAGQKYIGKALLGDRPEALRSLGTKIRKRKGLFGGATIPLALSYE